MVGTSRRFRRVRPESERVVLTVSGLPFTFWLLQYFCPPPVSYDWLTSPHFPCESFMTGRGKTFGSFFPARRTPTALNSRLRHFFHNLFCEWSRQVHVSGAGAIRNYSGMDSHSTDNCSFPAFAPFANFFTPIDRFDVNSCTLSLFERSIVRPKSIFMGLMVQCVLWFSKSRVPRCPCGSQVLPPGVVSQSLSSTDDGRAVSCHGD